MAKKSQETVKLEFLRAPAALGLAYHKGQIHNVGKELASELVKGGYAVVFNDSDTSEEGEAE